MQDSSDVKRRGFEFEQHYGLSRARARDVLHEILEDLAARKHIHNWDDKLNPSHLAALAVLARGYLNENPPHLDSRLEDAIVDEVLTVGGINRRPPVKTEAGPIDTHLFFTKKSSDEEKTTESLSLANESSGTECASGSTGSSGHDGMDTMPLSQGRIIYIKEEIGPLERASLLILHSFCIRLQYEDYGFIRTFIERHLCLRCVQKTPYHWQQISPPEVDSSRQKCYKRVTLSCHISYLTMKLHSTTSKHGVLDRTALFTLQPEKDKKNAVGLSVFKASSSVLLTLVFPTESESREEATNLLRIPQALWSVLVVNCSPNFASDQGPPEYLTPISQYIRGIASSLVTQRINAQTVYEAIKLELDRCEGDSLFDDEHFTKSKLYHRAVNGCNELAESISSSLRFLRNMLETQLKKLSRESHAYEKLGVEYWMQRMDEEMLALEDVQLQIIVLRARVQENRQALHGVTAILESRLALQQGDRMKSLAYLATIYLPLTSTASLYSMSVLPNSATLASFFVVFAISFLVTILLGIKLSPLLANLFHFTPRWNPQADPPSKTSDPSKEQEQEQEHGFKQSTLWAKLSQLDRILKALLPLKISGPSGGRYWVSNVDYIQGYLDILNPHTFLDPAISHPVDEWGDAAQSSMVFLTAWWVIRRIPVLALHHFLANEVNFPYYQWSLYQHRSSPDIHYHWIFFVRDFFRFLLLPVWVGLGAALLCHLVVQDALGFIFIPILSLALPFVLPIFDICGAILVIVWSLTFGVAFAIIYKFCVSPFVPATKSRWHRIVRYTRKKLGLEEDK